MDGILTSDAGTKRVVPIVPVLVCMTATGCAESPDFYGIGLEVIGAMDEMVQSRDYPERASDEI